METELSIAITKEQVAQMPVVEYPGGVGAVTVVDTAAKAKMALRALNKCTHIGFDTETKPTFQRGGRQHKVALLQLSDGEHCFLFRLNKDGIFELARPLLENPEIIKVGLSVHDDFSALRRRGDINPAGFLDLQDYARTFHIADISLQKIYAIVFGGRISKSQRLTNWEADTLTEQQQIYAAIDAWACLKLYRYMRSGAFHPAESPYCKIDEPAEAQPAEKS
jgi:ribonuclease D